MYVYQIKNVTLVWLCTRRRKVCGAGNAAVRVAMQRYHTALAHCGACVGGHQKQSNLLANTKKHARDCSIQLPACLETHARLCSADYYMPVMYLCLIGISPTSR